MNTLAQPQQSLKSDAAVTHLKHSLLQLIQFAERNLPQENCDDLFKGCLSLLEEALNNLKEAKDLVNQIAHSASEENVVVFPGKHGRMVAKKAIALEALLNNLPESGNVVLDFSTIESISSDIIAQCLKAQRTLRRRGDRLIFMNLSGALRETLEAVCLDRFFGLEAKGPKAA